MEKIQESAMNFKRLAETTTYKFTVSCHRKIRTINLTFQQKEFYHLAGLQYLKDISIPRNKDAVSWILNQNITDEYLAKSLYYRGSGTDEKDIEKRIAELARLEQYLDTNNFIRIFSPKDGPPNNSMIQCDYIIESRIPNSKTTVYIFIRKRSEDMENYGIISFCVKKCTSYGGQNLYWMQKLKNVDGVEYIISQHPNYQSN